MQSAYFHALLLLLQILKNSTNILSVIPIQTVTSLLIKEKEQISKFLIFSLKIIYKVNKYIFLGFFIKGLLLFVTCLD